MRFLNKKNVIVLLFIISLLSINFYYIKNLFLFFIEIIMSLILLIILYYKKLKKIENIFLLVGSFFGLLFVVIIPFCKVPDENAHFSRAYSISNGEFISKEINGKAYTLVPFKIQDICKVNNYYDYINILKNNNTEQSFFSNTALYNFIVYIPQTIGIILSKYLNLNPLFMIYFSRLFNLICYLSLIYFSIKIIPFFKEVIMTISLNPLALQEGASISSDSLTISISIFLISYLFYLYNKRELLKNKEYFILFVTSIICSLCKIVYLPLCFLIILLPNYKFLNKKDKIIKKYLIIISSIIVNLLWTKIASRYLIEYNPGVDSINQIKNIFNNPFKYLLIIIRSFKYYGINYMKSLFGSYISIYNVYLGNIYSSFSVLFLLFFSLFDNHKKDLITLKNRIYIILVFISIILLIFTSLYVQWTPLKNNVVEGVQGRYFIPLLLLIPFMLINNKTNKIILNKSIFKSFLLIYLIFQNINAIILVVKAYL